MELDQIYVLSDILNKEIFLATANVATPVKTPRSVQMPTKRSLKPREPVQKNALAYLTDKWNRETALKKINRTTRDKNNNRRKQIKIGRKKDAVRRKNIWSWFKRKIRNASYLPAVQSQQEIIKKLLEKEHVYN